MNRLAIIVVVVVDVVIGKRHVVLQCHAISKIQASFRLISVFVVIIIHSSSSSRIDGLYLEPFVGLTQQLAVQTATCPFGTSRTVIVVE